MHYLGARYIEKILEEGPLSTKISPPPTSDNSQKRSDYLLLIQARLYGWSGSNADKADKLELSTQTVTSLMNGQAEGFGLIQLIAIARKAGVSVKI